MYQYIKLEVQSLIEWLCVTYIVSDLFPFVSLLCPNLWVNVFLISIYALDFLSARALSYLYLFPQYSV